MSAASIIKKFLMAVTGLLWFAFLVGHLTGNFLLFQGPKKFNAYAEFLESTGGLLIAAEVALIVFLATHIYSGVKTAMENRAARPRDYEVKQTHGRATAFSRSMLAGGVITLVFIVTHVWMFKFGNHDGENGLHGLVMRSFQNPLTVAWYVLAMVAIGMHLSHGIGSAFQTLGVASKVWRTRLQNAGVVLGWVIAGGFITLPIWAFVAG